MSNLVESPEYAKLDPRDILVEASPKVAARIREHVPSPHDMHREMQRSVRHCVDGVEFVPREPRPSRGLWLAADPDKRYDRRKRYGQVTLPMEEAYDDSLSPDVVRHRVFRLVELMATAIAAEVIVEREKLQSPTPIAMTIRATPGTLPRFMDTYGESDGRVLTSLYTDEIVLRFAAYYFITPTGEEWTPNDDSE